ncbi:hypothetical protein DTM11_20300 [Escherichia coli]|nr:hypothetical protein DTM11_20300 [Escherichia coli]
MPVSVRQNDGRHTVSDSPFLPLFPAGYQRLWLPDHNDRVSVNAKIIGRFSPFLMSAIGH